uniref:Transcriptional repressor rco-1 n=1 Tax=Ganoderma boninense TaxID=34458 RepID=A0A5K1JTX1_9APHY|nr:Transcriptional repressor rco-1 [Ganoderma boninense]
MANSNFQTSAYIELHTLTKGHSDTINSLAFSRDGVHLASGGDDHLVIIWNAQNAQLLYRLVFESAVDCVIWHPVHPETVIIGLETGYLFQLRDFSLHAHQRHDIHLGVRSAVHCMDYSVRSQCLAIGMGEEVHITREKAQNVYEGDIVLPSPPNREDPPLNFDDRMRAVAVQFLQKEDSHLVVSYLAHGIM